MNEFTRKALALADDYAMSMYYDQRFGGQRYGEARDAARSALLAHLEGGHQKAWVPRNPAEVREFLGSHCHSMTYGDPSNPEKASENDLYDLTAHDVLSAFIWAGHFDDEAPATPTSEQANEH